jgi:multidrug efflux pump subunit AcrA (membrane-fusion protein)
MAVAAVVTGLAMTAAGAVMNYSAQQRAAKAQARAAAESARLAREQNAITAASNEAARRKEVRQAERERRIRTAQIMQAAQTGGVGDSSGAIGAMGGVATVTGTKVSDLAGNLATVNAYGVVSNAQAANQSALQRSLSSAQSLAALGGMISTVGKTTTSMGIVYGGAN